MTPACEISYGLKSTRLEWPVQSICWCKKAESIHCEIFPLARVAPAEQDSAFCLPFLLRGLFLTQKETKKSKLSYSFDGLNSLPSARTRFWSHSEPLISIVFSVTALTLIQTLSRSVIPLPRSSENSVPLCCRLTKMIYFLRVFASFFWIMIHHHRDGGFSSATPVKWLSAGKADAFSFPCASPVLSPLILPGTLTCCCLPICAVSPLSQSSFSSLCSPAGFALPQCAFMGSPSLQSTSLRSFQRCFRQPEHGGYSRPIAALPVLWGKLCSCTRSASCAGFTFCFHFHLFCGHT